jgi:hypothetical protein
MVDEAMKVGDADADADASDLFGVVKLIGL